MKITEPNLRQQVTLLLFLFCPASGTENVYTVPRDDTYF